MPLLYHRTTPPPSFGGYVPWAVAGHVILLIVMSVAITNSIKTAKPMAMQVRIVGVAAPSKAPVKQREPEPVRTQDSAAPKEPPPDTKVAPPSEAKTKFLKEKPPEEVKKDEKPNPIQAEKRPPVLDKNPNKKKIVKNDLKAKVVKNPEDYMAALDFIDKLETEQITPSPTLTAKPSDKPVGEGAQIQLDASEMGLVDGIRSHIEDNWSRPSGLDTQNLKAVVEVEVDKDGKLVSLRIIQSSGQGFYDQSLLRAVRKAEPLPIPADKYDVFKVLELHFAG